MTRKTHLHLQQYLPKAHKALQKHLHKVKRVVNSLNLNHHPPGASQTCSDRLDERDQQIVVELRYTQARKDTPPLHQRRGLEMSPIIQPHPSLYREITGAYRLAAHPGMGPYIHCRDCFCGVSTESTRCLCMECTLYHGVEWWLPNIDPPPVLWHERHQEWVSRVICSCIADYLK